VGGEVGVEGADIAPTGRQFEVGDAGDAIRFAVAGQESVRPYHAGQDVLAEIAFAALPRSFQFVAQHASLTQVNLVGKFFNRAGCNRPVLTSAAALGRTRTAILSQPAPVRCCGPALRARRLPIRRTPSSPWKTMPTQPHNSCLEACNQCAIACSQCLSACLQEVDVKAMARCIALDVECAETCRFAATVMARGSEHIATTCRLCAEICDSCAVECAKHAHDHCRRCAEACRTCAAECRQMAEKSLETRTR